ncbi:MAG: phosphatase PAP2 family protein [Bacteroidales bacterium]|nr:phosphatase PAP2 family protein [Bacteroidales bacterium]
MKRIITSALISVVCLCSAYAQQPYFATEELPDLVQCLPAPPKKGSPEFRYDVQRYRWGKAQRKDPERAAMARRDAIWSLDTTLVVLGEPFGIKVSMDDTPAIYEVLTRGITTIENIRFKPKAHYFRIRPFAYFKEPSIFPQDDEWLATEGSYPSGHTIRAWACALLMAEINPACAEAVFARAWASGESRVISGCHWQSDVDASRPAASIGYARLQASAAFRAQMALAQEEFRRLASPDQGGREHFVKISDVIPDVILEIRYYSTHNFVGRRIDGYLAPTAMLTRQAADSLKVVSDELKARGYRLKIYDAYRPQCAVDHFVRWAADVPDTLMKRCFYPDVDKSRLFELEFIMEKSGHTRGSTVDLTLFDMAAGKDLDMGGPFDWFGEESHPDYTGITPEQFANRMILRDAMLRHGFKPLDSEWWHFTLKNEPFPDTYFNFPVY